MFENIIKWIIDNKDSLISGVIGNGIFLGILQLWSLKNKIPNGVKILMNIKYIKYLGFILLYALPLGTITLMIVDKTNEPTFKNIALFIIICVSLIFNILMSHIRAIYKMFTELISKSSDIDNVHKKAINIIFEAIGKTERIK
ncbi:hypothetical protein [Flavobacterium succinicans]|uniref:hypothetical protein n=1 Tax=Flavobacterium succinicans TaxID=29536 RepID=UPI000468B9EE|nr:hypothetical protein [Flavobacterium succinicans]